MTTEMERYVRDPKAWLRETTRDYEIRRQDLNEDCDRRNYDLHYWYQHRLRKAYTWNMLLEGLDMLELELFGKTSVIRWGPFKWESWERARD